MSQIRMQLLELHPFWGHLLMQVKLLPAPELPTFAATDCVRRIWFNPNQTCQLNLRQLGFVLLHELGHIILLSAQRRMGRNLHLWNCATDYAINRMVAAVRHPATGEAMYESPNGTYPGIGEVRILHDPRWEGLVAETIYERLAGEALPDPVTLTVRLGSDGSVSRVPHVSSHGGGIDIHLPRGLSDEEADEVTDAVRRAVAAWRSAGSRGDVPGEVVRLIGTATTTYVPWRTVLQRWLRRSFGRLEFDPRRPDRRMMELGCFVPRARQERRGRLVVAMDTSGSMDTSLLAQCVAEVQKLANLAPDITLVVADARVQKVVESADVKAFLRERRLPGGGGTDHRPVFEWLAGRVTPPDLFVGITDLYTRFPARPPSCPVVWVAPSPHGNAPWGHVVELP